MSPRSVQTPVPTVGLRVRRGAVAGVLGLCLALGSGPPVGASEHHSRPTGAVVYARPVPGPVLRAFAAPESDFGPGHRGVDLAVTPGEVVRAAAVGVVVFAGSVAGERWVSIAHPDGRRSSYGALGAVVVAEGESVSRGEVIGRAVAATHAPPVAALHWGVRRRLQYEDPLALLDAGPWRPALVGPGGWEATHEPHVPRYDDWDGEHRFGFVPGADVATHAGWVFAPNPNHVIGVAGLGSSDRKVPIDLAHLGYATEDITYLSYAGRRDVRGLDPGDPRRDQLPYGPEHTGKGVLRAALALRDQLRAQWKRSPGQAVDLVGHSMGGVVIMTYLLVLHDPTDPSLPPIAHVATLDSPLEGTEAANLILDGLSSVTGRAILDTISDRIPDHDAQAPAVADLAVGSPLIEHVGESWVRANSDTHAGPLATGTRVLTTGASRDPFVVPEHRTDLPGAEHVVLPGSHDGIRLTEASRIVLRAFLADDPVPGESGGVAHWLSYGLSYAQREVGAKLRAVGRLLDPP